MRSTSILRAQNLVIASVAKQSIILGAVARKMDCFASLAMTGLMGQKLWCLAGIAA